MGLITKEVEVVLTGNNINWYENLGYEIPRWINKAGEKRVKRGTKILVKVEDLPDKSPVLVDIKCNGCGKILTNIRWYAYKESVKEDGSYYCQKCAIKLYGNENTRLTNLKNGKSIYQWCIENNRQDILDRWDYELNKYRPDELAYGTNKYIYLKCPRGLHKSELKKIVNLTINKEEGSIKCNQCNSFAQWGIDNIDNDFLNKYWDEINTINPWEIDHSSTKSVYIKCQEKEYHGSYNVRCNSFTGKNCRCPFCNKNSGKVHPFDSLGKLLEDKNLLNIWSNKNNKSSYKYTQHNDERVWFKCFDKKHNDYFRRIKDAFKCNFICPDCVRERTESFLQEKIRLYINKYKYTILHEYKCSIIPKNPKNKSGYYMPYDNEIKELRLIIECNGIQHYFVTGFHKKHAKRNDTTPEYELHMQQVRDRYKRIFAKSQGFFYLEIPFWTDDENEIWKKLIDDKISSIKDIQIEEVKNNNVYASRL